MITPPFIGACHSTMESEVGEPRRVRGPTRHGGGPMRRGALFLLPFEGIRTLGARATSRWRANATWRGPNATWRALFAPFWAVLAPLRRSHVVLEPQRDMAHSQCDVAGPHTILHRLFLGRLTQKSHLRTKSEVAGLMLIWFLVCLTCQLGH